MAAKYRKVDPRIWTDEGFVQLTSQEKLIAIHAFTNSQSNRCGIFPFSKGMAADDTSIDSDTYAIGFDRVCDTLHWKYDQERRVLYLPTWWKYNPPANPKHLKGCLTDLVDLPQTQLLKEFAENTSHIPKDCLTGFEIPIPIRMPLPMAYQKQKQEQEQNQKNSPASAGSDGTRKRDRKSPTGPHAELIAHFCTRWKSDYGADYLFAAGKDAKHIKTILDSAKGDFQEAVRIVDTYLSDKDGFLVNLAHPLGNLVARINKYIAKTGVSNGKHRPTASERGQFAESNNTLPRFGAKAGNVGGGS